MGTLQKSALSSPGVFTKFEKISKRKVSYKLSYEQALKAKGVGCDICTSVVTEIDKLLQFVEQLCTAIDGLFPGSGATCNALVETYLPQIIEGLINNQLSPASVCETLTLCP